MRSAQQQEWKVPGQGGGDSVSVPRTPLSCNLSLSASWLLDKLRTGMLCGREARGDDVSGMNLVHRFENAVQSVASSEQSLPRVSSGILQRNKIG